MGCLLFAERLDSSDELGLIEAGDMTQETSKKKESSHVISLTRNLYDDVRITPENVANSNFYVLDPVRRYVMFKSPASSVGLFHFQSLRRSASKLASSCL